MGNTDSKKSMTGAQAVIASLEAAGVDTLFGYPGGSSIAMHDALHDSDMNHILVRQEGGAAHAADGYARATGKPGVCLVTSGPGATNVITGIYTAFMDSIPMVIITAQVSTGLIGTDAFQEVDITGLTMPIVKHSYLVKDVEDIPATIWKAFHIATTGRPGPVLVDIPSDIQCEMLDFEYPQSVNIPSYKSTFKGHGKMIKAAVEEILQANKPVLFVGGGGVGAAEPLKELAEMMQIPVVNTLMGKGIFPDRHHLSQGMLGMYGSRYANTAMQEADLLIAVGVRFDDRVTGSIDTFADQARIIHIDIDPAEIGKNIKPQVPIVGDANSIVSDIVKELHKRAATPRSADWVARVDTLRRENPFSYDNSISGAIQPEFVLERLNEIARKLDLDLVITTEVGQHQIWAAQYLDSEAPRHFLTSGGAGTMGFGLPAALGAQSGKPGSTVLCVAGDGSLQMNIQEMATIAVEGAPVKVLLLDNSYLGMVAQLQSLIWDNRISYTKLDKRIPNFTKLSQAYGWSAWDLTDPAEIDSALERLLTTEGPALLDVHITEGELVLPMVLPGSSIDEPLDIQPQPACTYTQEV